MNMEIGHIDFAWKYCYKCKNKFSKMWIGTTESYREFLFEGNKCTFCGSNNYRMDGVTIDLNVLESIDEEIIE